MGITVRPPDARPVGARGGQWGSRRGLKTKIYVKINEKILKQNKIIISQKQQQIIKKQFLQHRSTRNVMVNLNL